MKIFWKWMTAVFGVVCVYAVFQSLHFEDLIRPERVQSFLVDLGTLAPFAFIGLMAMAVVISPIPSLPLDLAAGAATDEHASGSASHAVHGT